MWRPSFRRKRSGCRTVRLAPGFSPGICSPRPRQLCLPTYWQLWSAGVQIFLASLPLLDQWEKEPRRRHLPSRKMWLQRLEQLWCSAPLPWKRGLWEPRLWSARYTGCEPKTFPSVGSRADTCSSSGEPLTASTFFSPQISSDSMPRDLPPPTICT